MVAHQSYANRAPCTLHSTPTINPGTAHPLAAYDGNSMLLSLPITYCSQMRLPSATCYILHAVHFHDVIFFCSLWLLRIQLLTIRHTPTARRPHRRAPQGHSTTLCRRSTTLRRRSTTLRRRSATLRRRSTTLSRCSTNLRRRSTTLRRRSTTLRRRSTNLRRCSAISRR